VIRVNDRSPLQEPLDNLSNHARIVYGNLLAHVDGRNREPEAIAESLGGELTPGEVADALRELEVARRAAHAFGGWSVLT
jgi:hypothetical protein